jgi:hypothetical protein
MQDEVPKFVRDSERARLSGEVVSHPHDAANLRLIPEP